MELFLVASENYKFIFKIMELFDGTKVRSKDCKFFTIITVPQKEVEDFFFIARFVLRVCDTRGKGMSIEQL